MVIPMFIITCQKNMLVTPTTKMVPKGSRQPWAMLSPQKISIKNNSTTTIDPMKPHSSAKTENMKSVCCSGRNDSLFCGPSPNPWPSHPPEPIATRDWIRCHPAPRGSIPGFRNTSSRFCWYGARLFHSGVARAPAARFPAATARWQSGYAADCNSVYAGSIPTRASTNYLI